MPILCLALRAQGSAGQWCASLPVQPNVVFIAGVVASQQASLAVLSQAGQWNWTSGQLCVFNPSQPPVQVEAAQRDFGLLLGQTGSGSYVTVSGIDFRLANTDTVHIANTTGDIIDSCSITGAYQFGIFAIGVNGTKVDQLRISNNTVSLHGSSGIEISSGHSNVTVNHNTVFENAYNAQNSGNFVFMAGIYLYNNVQSFNNDLVQYNVSHDNGVAGGSESQGAGIWLDTLSNSTVQYNVAFNNVSHGIYLEKNVNSLMSGNLSYSNATAANSANITCYADFGVSASGNTLSGNISWKSHSWGMKLGAYQAGGVTQFQGNLIENNIVLNSATLALFVDSGANNNMTNGWNNRYLCNTFGLEAHDWIYWTGVGWISTYAELQAAYGASTGSNVVDMNGALKIMNRLPLSSSTIALIRASIGD